MSYDIIHPRAPISILATVATVAFLVGLGAIYQDLAILDLTRRVWLLIVVILSAIVVAGLIRMAVGGEVTVGYFVSILGILVIVQYLVRIYMIDIGHPVVIHWMELRVEFK